MHEKLAKYRGIGEWFNITPEQAEKEVKNAIEGYEINPVISKYRQGVSISQIARDEGVTRQAILNHLRTYGVYNKQERNNKIKQGKPIIANNPKKENANKLPQIVFLDNKEPPSSIINSRFFKRQEPNIFEYDNWYVAKVYRDGGFKSGYSTSIEVVREFRDK